MYIQEATKDKNKAKRSSWVNAWIVYKPDFFGSCGAFVTNSGILYEPSTDDVIADDWEPYKEPCKHEPKDVSQFVARPFVGIVEANVFLEECKLCGAKIKAVGWEGV